MTHTVQLCSRLRGIALILPRKVQYLLLLSWLLQIQSYLIRLLWSTPLYPHVCVRQTGS